MTRSSVPKLPSGDHRRSWTSEEICERAGLHRIISMKDLDDAIEALTDVLDDWGYGSDFLKDVESQKHHLDRNSSGFIFRPVYALRRWTTGREDEDLIADLAKIFDLKEWEIEEIRHRARLPVVETKEDLRRTIHQLVDFTYDCTCTGPAGFIEEIENGTEYGLGADATRAAYALKCWLTGEEDHELLMDLADAFAKRDAKEEAAK